MDRIMAEEANEKTVEDPWPEHELLKALERETNTCKRQELLKALWRVGKDYGSESSQSSAVTNRTRLKSTYCAGLMQTPARI